MSDMNIERPAPSLLTAAGEEVMGPPIVAICIPSAGTVPTAFAFDLARLALFTYATSPSIDLRVLVAEGSVVPKNRQELAARAIRLGASHIFWLDTDVRFPKDALLRLLDAREPVVAGAYPTRELPVRVVAFPHAGDDTRLEVPEGATGYADVEVVGFGCLLMKTETLRTVKLPWFLFSWDEQALAFDGEDAYLCRKLREAGYKVRIDLALSRELSHIGAYEFTHQHADAFRVVASPATE